MFRKVGLPLLPLAHLVSTTGPNTVVLSPIWYLASDQASALGGVGVVEGVGVGAGVAVGAGPQATTDASNRRTNPTSKNEDHVILLFTSTS